MRAAGQASAKPPDHSPVVVRAVEAPRRVAVLLALRGSARPRADGMSGSFYRVNASGMVARDENERDSEMVKV